MKRSISTMLMLCMLLMLVVSPVSSLAEDALIITEAPKEADEVVFTDTFENITDNLLYPSSATPEKGGISKFSFYDPQNYGIVNQISADGSSSRIGVMKSTDTTNTIQFTHLYDDTGSRNVAPYYTLQYWYNQGYDTLVMGRKIPSNTDGDGKYTGTATYSGTDNGDSGGTGIKFSGKPFDGAYLKSVASPTGENDKVLEYNLGTFSNSIDCWTLFKGLQMRMSVGTDKVHIADKDGVADGRKLAYSWDVYVPAQAATMFYSRANINLGGVGAKVTDSSKPVPTLLDDRALYESGKLYYRITGYDLADTARSTSINHKIHLTTDAWHKITQIITFNGDAYPIVAFYLDGEKVHEVIAYNPINVSTSTGYYTGKVEFKFTPHKQNTQSAKYNIFMNNIMQYYIKELAVSGVEDSYAGFTSNDSITLNYTTPIDFEALGEAVSVTQDGNSANATAIVEKVDDYNAKISFSGLDVSKETTYELTINEFADIYGQKQAGKVVAITTKQAGKIAISLSETEIGYEANTHKTFAITTDVKTDVSNVKFYLKNSSNETVAELTPTANQEQTVFTFDLFDASLPETVASYTFVTEGEFKEVDGDATNNDVISIPVCVVNYDYTGKYIINDDFNSGTKDVNWLVDKSARYTGWSTGWRHLDVSRGEYALNSDGVYSYQNCSSCSTFANNFLTDYFIGIVTDPKDATNSVVKYQAGKNGDGKHGTRVIKYYETTIDTSKNVVMSSRILLTESMKNYMADYLYNDLPVLSTRNNLEDRFLAAQVKTSGDNLVLTGRDSFSTTLKTDEWFELKYIIMPTTTKEETKDDSGVVTAVKYDVWTYMVYINDVLIEVGEKSEFVGPLTTQVISGVTYEGGFTTIDNKGNRLYGVHFGLYPTNNGETTPTFYVDDVKLYQPTQLEGKAELIDNVLTVTYNNVLAKNVRDTVEISTPQNMIVEDVILNKAVSADGKTLKLTIDVEKLGYSETYNVTGVYDSIGQKSKEVSFVTPISFGLYVDEVTDIDTSEAGKIKTTVKIANAQSQSLEAFLIVAAYGDYNEMLGSASTEIDGIDASGYKENVIIDLAGKNISDVRRVKVFLWNGLKKMIPYQNSVIIYGE